MPRIQCPDCQGTGIDWLFALTCETCQGQGHIPDPNQPQQPESEDSQDKPNQPNKENTNNG